MATGSEQPFNLLEVPVDPRGGFNRIVMDPSQDEVEIAGLPWGGAQCSPDSSALDEDDGNYDDHYQSS